MAREELVTLHADGVSDDGKYFQALVDGRLVSRSDGKPCDGKPGDYIARIIFDSEEPCQI